MKGFKSSQPLRIFLCHSSGDKPAVRELYRRLLKDGFRPWLDEEDLLPGQNWQQEISKAVRASDVIVVCLSRASINKSGYVQKEIKFALDVADQQPDGTLFLIPVKLEECDLPEQLRQWHWVNLFEEKGYERLAKSLQLRATTLNKEVKHSTGTEHAVTTISKSINPNEPAGRAVGRGLRTYQSASSAASWIFGAALLVLLFIVISLLPNPTQSQKDTIRFLIALAAGFFGFFFAGGVLLKGTLKGLLISATGGLALFVLIQFIFDPFNATRNRNPVRDTEYPSAAPLSPVPASAVSNSSNSVPSPGSTPTPRWAGTPTASPTLQIANNPAAIDQVRQTLPDTINTPTPTPLPAPSIPSITNPYLITRRPDSSPADCPEMPPLEEEKDSPTNADFAREIEDLRRGRAPLPGTETSRRGESWERSHRRSQRQLEVKRRELYESFQNNCKTNPDVAYKNGKRFLQKYPRDPYARFVQSYIDAYEKSKGMN